MSERLPAHLEVAGMIRLAQAQGGFATVMAKGERDAGTLLLLTVQQGQNSVLYERLPQLDGSRPYCAAKREDSEKKQEFSEYLQRRVKQDPDIWILEVDIADPERFIASLPS